MPCVDRLVISIADQQLYTFKQQQLIGRYPVSTALNGAGEQNGSGCTPRGEHYVRACIGAGLPQGAVLRGRRWTQEVWSPQLHAEHPERDWILSRILWLSGCELGTNRLGNVDTFRRYIYIHGTPDCEPMGEARSHGCVRMRNADLVSLFDHVKAGCPVTISEAAYPQWAAAELKREEV